MNEDFYMKRCLELARKAEGQTYPNPLVGSVIVYQDKIIGEGYHKKAGEHHAEINAINSVQDPSVLKDATIYVSLEPCSHYGKTPPCAVKLAEIGFKKVVIGALDPHEKVNGKGKKILEDAGIEVVSGILKKECAELNKRFFTYHQKNRPYLILKWAQSADGFIDQDFRSTMISNSLTKQFVHYLRAREHGILVGVQTALTDNPSLTTREIAGRNPVRILLDPQLAVPKNAAIFDAQAPTLVLNEHKDDVLNNIEYLQTNITDIHQGLMSALYHKHLQSILVEGGSKTLSRFISADLWDEAIIITNKNLNLHSGTKAPAFNGKTTKTIEMGDNFVNFYTNSKNIVP